MELEGRMAVVGAMHPVFENEANAAVAKVGWAMLAAGLSYRGILAILAAFGIRISGMTIWRDEPQAPLDQLRYLLIRMSAHRASSSTFGWQQEVPWTNFSNSPTVFGTNTSSVLLI